MATTSEGRGAEKSAERDALLERTMAIARETSARWPAHLKDWDYDAWLYDDDGLPRSG